MWKLLACVDFAPSTVHLMSLWFSSGDCRTTTVVIDNDCRGRTPAFSFVSSPLDGVITKIAEFKDAVKFGIFALKDGLTRI